MWRPQRTCQRRCGRRCPRAAHREGREHRIGLGLSMCSTEQLPCAARVVPALRWFFPLGIGLHHGEPSCCAVGHLAERLLEW
jgi:hypothetical protein